MIGFFVRVVTILCLALFISITDAVAGTTVYGYSGIILTPSAIPLTDGTLTLGINRMPRLYNDSLLKFSRTCVSASITFLPRLEIMLSITRPDEYDGGLGDRSGAVRFYLLEEKKITPALAIGAQDFFAAHQLHFEPVSAQHFSSTYFVLSKSFIDKSLRVSLGYGDDIIPANHHHLVGGFGGIEWQPNDWMNFLVEYDTQNWNAGFEFLIFDHLTFQFSWWKLQHLMGSINFNFKLLDE